MQKILLSIIITLSSCFLFGQTNQLDIASNMLDTRGEVYFSFHMDKEFSTTLVRLNKVISIAKIEETEVFAYANKKEFSNFLKFEIDFEVHTPPSMMYPSILENSKMARNIDEWDYYPNWDEYKVKMNNFVSTYPELCELVTIGTSNEGREIMCIHINDNIGEDQGEPEFLYTSSIHGDELVGYILTLRLIDYLLSNYGVIGDVTTMVEDIDIWINPLANPDGTFAGGNNSVWGATRGNSLNIDLNRNFIDPEDGPHPDGNAWQTETEIFMDFAADHNFVMSSNMHEGEEVVNYPWDTWSRLSPDDDWWILVSREYADLVHENSWAGYLDGFDNGITNGYAWYSISGGRQDYMNYFHNCREMTLELSMVKTPPESQLNNFWNANYKSLLAYMQQVLHGLSGTVTNAVTGNAVIAEVFIENHDIDSTQVFSHQPLGDYHRPIKSGNYDVTFSALGFYDQTINVDIEDGENYELNVILMPFGTLMSDFESSTTIAGSGSNIDFFDNSLGNDIVSWEWTFEGGNPAVSTDVNPVDITYENTGSWDVTLVVTNQSGDTDTKYIEDFIIIKDAVSIENGSVTICDALFYDTGFENSNYSNDEDFIMTFYPETLDMEVILDFIEFDIENHFYCENDYMEIFDGEDVNAPSLGSWCGTNSPGRVYAINDAGALTVLFHSNSSVTKSGWKAEISCDSNVGVTYNNKQEFNLFPNPASSYINMLFDGEINDIKLVNMQGAIVYEIDAAVNNLRIVTAKIESGVYTLLFTSNGNRIVRKVLIAN